MNNKKIELVKESCPKGEKFLYVFSASIPPTWTTRCRNVLVGVTDKSIYFIRLNFMGKAVGQTDTFNFNEIKAVTVKNSFVEKVAKIEFANGRNLVLHILKFMKGDSEEALAYLQKEIL